MASTPGTVPSLLVSDRRWVVVGAGAVGGTIGGRLHQGGGDVLLVARGAHGEAIRRHGLLLRDPDTEARLDIESVERPADVSWRDGDVVLVATKTHQATAVLDDVVAVAPEVPVVCATNGVEAERLALRRFGSVHGMCVMLPAAHLEPGVVEASSAPCSGILDIGLAVGEHDEVDDALAAALRTGGFVADPDDDILRRKRAKLLMNLANVLDAACGPDPGWRPARRPRAASEGVAVLRRRRPRPTPARRRTAPGAATTSACGRSTASGGAAGRPGRAWPGARAPPRPTSSTARSSCSAASTACRHR